MICHSVYLQWFALQTPQRSFQGGSLRVIGSPGLKPWPESSCPFGTNIPRQFLLSLRDEYSARNSSCHFGTTYFAPVLALLWKKYQCRALLRSMKKGLAPASSQGGSTKPLLKTPINREGTTNVRKAIRWRGPIPQLTLLRPEP